MCGGDAGGDGAEAGAARIDFVTRPLGALPPLLLLLLLARC